MTQHTLKSNFETVLLPPKGQFFDRSGAKDTPRTVEPEPALLPITGVHPAVIKIAMSAVVWFLAVAWFDFSGGPEVDLDLAVITGFFVMFFTLFLMAASMVIDDPRWKQPKGSLRRVSFMARPRMCWRRSTPLVLICPRASPIHRPSAR